METQEFKALVESGQLTIGQALDHAISMPKSGKTIPDLQKAIQAGKLGDTTLDTPLAEAFKSESFLSNVDTPKANYYVSVQGFENALKTAFVRAKIPYLSTLGLETELAGSSGLLQAGGYSEGQLRRTRQMQGLIPSADLDAAYADAFTNMSAKGSNVSDDTKRFLFFHKNTVVRVETVLGSTATKTAPAKPPMTLADVIISSDPDTGEPTVTLKGESRVNKTRLPVTYKGTMAALLKEQFDIARARGGSKDLKDIKLFDTTKVKTDAAHNKYIKPIVEERFPTQIPIDPKSGASGWRPTDIRSAVQDQLEKEFRIDPALAEDYAGHKVKDAYKSSGANPSTIGEISENLVRQSAKNLGVGTTNSVVVSKFGLTSPALSAENVSSFPALAENYRGVGQTLQASTVLSEAQKAEIDSAAFLSSEKQTAQALKIQADNIRQQQNLDVKGAKEGFERQQEVAGIKKQLKQEKIVASGEDFIAKALKMAKPIAKVVLPPVGLAASMFVSRETYGSTRDQLTDLGLPEPLAQAGGALAGATEFLPVAPSDVIEVGRSMASPVADPGSARPIERMMADQPELFNQSNQPQITKPVKIPDPVPTQQGMLAAGGAKQRVNQARSAALAGEETSMSGSFLN
jgi:hypothetical protein